MSFLSPGWLWALVALVPMAAGLVAWSRSGRRAGERWSDPAVMAVGTTAIMHRNAAPTNVMRIIRRSR